MNALIVAGFKDGYRASDVLNSLEQRGFDWADDLDNAVVIRFSEPNKVKVQFRVDISAEIDTRWLKLWGSFLNVALVTSSSGFVLDVDEGLSNAKCRTDLANDAKWWIEEFQIPGNFLRDVGGMIQPGDSAIFMFARKELPQMFLKQIRTHGGTPLHFVLTPDQHAKLAGALQA